MILKKGAPYYIIRHIIRAVAMSQKNEHWRFVNLHWIAGLVLNRIQNTVLELKLQYTETNKRSFLIISDAAVAINHAYLPDDFEGRTYAVMSHKMPR